jgi:ribose transport system substrate-binding protein
MTGLLAQRTFIMAQDHDRREYRVSRRHALGRMFWAGTACTILPVAPTRLRLFERAEAALTAQARPTIVVIAKNSTSPYWRTVLSGACRAGQDFDVKVIDLAAQSDTDLSAQLEIAVTSNPTAVVIAPAGFEQLRTPLDEAAKKIRIIGLDSPVDSRAFTSILKSDGVQAGRIAADIVAERIQKTYADAEGDVALLIPSAKTVAIDQRASGFKEQLTAKYGALNIVTEKEVDPASSHDVMAEIIAGFPELRGVFVADLTVVLGAAQAIAENKTNKTGDKINLVGFDWDEKLVDLLDRGTIAALVVRDPFRLGYESVKAALAASKGEQVPALIDIAAGLVTKANMNSSRSQELLHPKMEC